jgi:hypothetical protein
VKGESKRGERTCVVLLVDLVELLDVLVSEVDDREVGCAKIVEHTEQNEKHKASNLHSIREFVTDFGNTVTPSLFACKLTSTFAGLTLYLSASFFTVSFVNSGELSEPRGE